MVAFDMYQADQKNYVLLWKTPKKFIVGSAQLYQQKAISRCLSFFLATLLM